MDLEPETGGLLARRIWAVSHEGHYSVQLGRESERQTAES